MPRAADCAAEVRCLAAAIPAHSPGTVRQCLAAQTGRGRFVGRRSHQRIKPSPDIGVHGLKADWLLLLVLCSSHDSRLLQFCTCRCLQICTTVRAFTCGALCSPLHSKVWQTTCGIVGSNRVHGRIGCTVVGMARETCSYIR